MDNFIFLLTCIACMCHGRRIQIWNQQEHENQYAQNQGRASAGSVSTPLNSVARLLAALTPASAFNPCSPGHVVPGRLGCCMMRVSDEVGQARRALLQTAALGAGVSPLLDTLQAFAADDKRPVLVLGSNGGTGRACVDYLLSQGKACIASTRTGDFEGADPSKGLLTVAKCDVSSADSMGALIQPGKLAGVIYAASASRQKEAKATSNAKAIDEAGVVECAKLCIASEVPRMVLVSSGGVSKPKSAVYLFLNVAAGGIMDAKISGEYQMRRLYAAPGVAEKNVGYTIVRPGGLTKEASLGVGSVELNQGDDKSGRIARSDVAAICIESLASKAAFDTTFECYYGDTAKGLNDVFASNAKKATDGAETAKTGRERRGETWPQLFDGLERDRVV